MKDKNHVKSGLQRKIMILCVVMVVSAIAVFAAAGIVEINIAANMTENTSKTKSEIISAKSENSMLTITREDLFRTVSLASSLLNEELWVMEHDFYVLSSQVKDVFMNPENYAEIEVNPPQKENECSYVLQVMYPEESYKTDEQTQYIIRRLANLAPMMAEIVDGNDDFSMDCYIVLSNGTALMMDEFSGQKFDENGNLKHYDPRQRPWFEEALQAKESEVVITSAIKSYFYDINEVIYAVPVFLDGRIVAVLEGSINLDTIREKVSGVSYGEQGFSIILDENGLVFSPRTEGELSMDNELTTSIKGRVNADLEKLLTKEIWNKVGFDRVKVDGEKYYAAFAPIKTIGWMQVMFVPQEQIEQPTNELLAELKRISDDSINEFAMVFRNEIIKTFIALGILIVGAVITSHVFSSKIAKPLNIMTKQVKKLDGDNLVFQKEDAYKTGDEIEILADAFDALSKRTRKYIDELMQVTSERERMQAELSVAALIQTDMLPKDFPLFPERGEFDVYASMDTAKEVGGDFYDIFMIDDDHLALVMGDVSGKGVSAALFMVKSKMLIENLAMASGTPGEILEKVNNKLIEGNSAQMFVTVWMGILTISTGHLVEANAGHMNPAVRIGDKPFELVVKKHGAFLGIRKDKKYADDELVLAKGDCLFIYTDGVNEAENIHQEQFGTDRMVETLNSHPDDSPKELLASMKNAVVTFAGNATRSDDITMLAIKYNGR